MTYFNEFGQGRVGFRAPSGLTPLLLDTYSGAAAAYSLRKLRTAYTGNAITVRRSSDNTSQQIGFDANGNLDTTALTTFVGAGNGFVSTWFDQSGNGRDLTQATAANQPRIVNSGVIEILNGKAGLYNSSSSVTSPNRMSANFGTTLSQPNTMFILGSSNFVTGGGTIIDGIVNGSRNSLAALDATKLYIFAGSLVQLNYAANSNTQRLLYGKFSTTSSAIAVNNGTAATGNVGVQPLTGIIINAAYTNGAGSTLNYQQEIIIWNADRSSDRTGISNDINTYYSTY
jgi:hypothetical protein